MKAAGVATTVAGNDDWITDKESSDPKVLPHLPGYHILIRPVAIREKTKGGILLPDKFKGRAWCKPGDYVVYGKYQGDKFFYKGIRMLLLFDDQILMVVPDPADLDPNYLDIKK